MPVVAGGDGHIIATTRAAPNRAPIFLYDTGDHLANGSLAPGRRVGWYQSNNTATFWTDPGASWFRQAINWMLAPSTLAFGASVFGDEFA